MTSARGISSLHVMGRPPSPSVTIMPSKRSGVLCSLFRVPLIDVTCCGAGMRWPKTPHHHFWTASVPGACPIVRLRANLSPLGIPVRRSLTPPPARQPLQTCALPASQVKRFISWIIRRYEGLRATLHEAPHHTIAVGVPGFWRGGKVAGRRRRPGKSKRGRLMRWVPRTSISHIALALIGGSFSRCCSSSEPRELCP